jgi:hypothetical protein
VLLLGEIVGTEIAVEELEKLCDSVGYMQCALLSRWLLSWLVRCVHGISLHFTLCQRPWDADWLPFCTLMI